mmetsp:Transcript_59844/g.99291  ORF Transcript_59844/g.99291 Transcript_59844/m.99291 type:complete len:88 (+) Transcript_59844:875-1138(+)
MRAARLHIEMADLTGPIHCLDAAGEGDFVPIAKWFLPIGGYARTPCLLLGEPVGKPESVLGKGRICELAYVNATICEATQPVARDEA